MHHVKPLRASRFSNGTVNGVGIAGDQNDDLSLDGLTFDEDSSSAKGILAGEAFNVSCTVDKSVIPSHTWKTLIIKTGIGTQFRATSYNRKVPSTRRVCGILIENDRIIIVDQIFILYMIRSTGTRVHEYVPITLNPFSVFALNRSPLACDTEALPAAL